MVVDGWWGGGAFLTFSLDSPWMLGSVFGGIAPKYSLCMALRLISKKSLLQQQGRKRFRHMLTLKKGHLSTCGNATLPFLRKLWCSVHSVRVHDQQQRTRYWVLCWTLCTSTTCTAA